MNSNPVSYTAVTVVAVGGGDGDGKAVEVAVVFGIVDIVDEDEVVGVIDAALVAALVVFPLAHVVEVIINPAAAAAAAATDDDDDNGG